MFKTVIYNTGAQTIGKIITASATLLVTILIGYALGETGYGEFTKIFVFVGYFYILSDFGLNTIYIKIAKDNPLPLLKALAATRLVMSLALIAAAVFISFFLPYDPVEKTGFSPLVKTGILISSLTILTHALFTTGNAYFQKTLRYDLSALAAILGSIIILVLVFASTAFNIGLLGYVVSYVAGGAVFVLTSFYLIARLTGKIILPEFNLAEAKNLITRAWPVGLALIVNLLYFRIDVFILASARPSQEVGLYGLAYQFFEAALSIPIFFANAIYPLLNNLYHQNLSEFRAQVRAWLKLLTLFSAFQSAGLFIGAYLIPIVFQGKFVGSVPALQVLSLGIPLFFISALLWHVLIICDKQKYLIYIYAFGAIFNLVANLIFIPAYGYMAAAIITVISEALIAALLFLSVLKSNKL